VLDSTIQATLPAFTLVIFQIGSCTNFVQGCFVGGGSGLFLFIYLGETGV
jgi:hypothetical protein